MNTAAYNQQAASLLLRFLYEGGVQSAVISPGSRSTPLVLAADGIQDLKKYVILDERNAAFVALGIAKAEQRPVLLVCTSGSALAHYLPAVLEASYARVPLIILSADRPPELQHCGAPQTINQTQLFGSHVRFFADLGCPHEELTYLRSTAAQALSAATGTCAGPVHLNMPFREPLWTPAPISIPDLHAVEILRDTPKPSRHLVETLAKRLHGKGIFVFGPQNPPRSTDESQELAEALGAVAEKLGWPILAETASQLRVHSDLNNLQICTYDALLRSESFAAKYIPDIIVRVGQTPTSKVLSQWLAAVGEGKTYWVDPDGLWLDPSHTTTSLVVAEPRFLLQELLHNVEPSHNRDWLCDWRAAEEKAQACISTHAQQDTLWEGAIARIVFESIPEGSWLQVASSMPIREVDAFAAPRQRLVHVSVNRGTNGIDGTLCTTFGASLSWPRHCYVLCGDLAFFHDQSALFSAAQLGVSATVIVVNNHGGGIFGFLPIAQHPSAFERYFLTPQQGNIEDSCRVSGAEYHRIGSLSALKNRLQETCHGLRVLELVVSREDNMKQRQSVLADIQHQISCQ